MMTMTFNELRRIKDSLPDGSMHKIAQDMGVSVETVRNYFGGSNFRKGDAVGIHYEPGGPDGGLVKIDDSTILDRALKMIPQAATN
ncbi:MAG: DNA-binding protein [Bacteroidota bacterium]